MKNGLMLVAAGALALSPATALAQQTNGSENGVGWGNGPDATGQPGVECEDLIEEEEGAVPGRAANGKSAFGGFAHEQYAGEQDQNSVNLATSSQYDIACAKQDPDTSGG